MATLGPSDHGRPMSYGEFMAGDYREGYKYELIDGRLYVSQHPELAEARVEEWLRDQLDQYAQEHPEVINYVTGKARVFVPGRKETTAPEPDLAAYQAFPRNRPIRGLSWKDVSPVLVIEVLHGDDVVKDLVRNVELYHQVPTIKEYWVLDARADPDRPSLRVHRRSGRPWRVADLAFGETYATRLLPGFRLILAPGC
jgi:Uma2 family endonuclease